MSFDDKTLSKVFQNPLILPNLSSRHHTCRKCNESDLRRTISLTQRLHDPLVIGCGLVRNQQSHLLGAMELAFPTMVFNRDTGLNQSGSIGLPIGFY